MAKQKYDKAFFSPSLSVFCSSVREREGRKTKKRNVHPGGVRYDYKREFVLD
jgi:hypothetical protein